MHVPFSSWRSLVPSEMSQVPETPGVFEIGNLVRTVLYIGAAHENLRTALTHHLGTPGHPLMHTSRLYFRFFATEDPQRSQAELVKAYQRTHGGALPPAQGMPALPAGQRRHLKAV